MTRITRTVLTLALLGGLLAGGIGLAQMRGGRSFGDRGAPGAFGAQERAQVHAPMAARGLGVTAGPATAWAGVPRLGGLALGSSVEVRLYDQEPTEGAVARTTLTLTVGEDSEAAFADALAEARAEAADWEVAFLVVNVSEQTRTVELPGDDDTRPVRGARAFGLRLPGVGLQGDGAITVALYDGDPAAGGTLLETLSFTHGVDSAIGFRAALDEALAAATHAVVTTSPRTDTIDLKAVEARVADTAAGRAAIDARRAAMAERFGARRGDDDPAAFGRPDGRAPWGGRGMPGRR